MTGPETRDLTPEQFLKLFAEWSWWERRFRRADWARSITVTLCVLMNVALVPIASWWWLNLGTAMYCAVVMQRVILLARDRRRSWEQVERRAAFARYLTAPDLRSDAARRLDSS